MKIDMFLKWLILTLGIGLTVGVLEECYGVFSKVAVADFTCICIVIYVLFMYGVLLQLRRCFVQDNNFERIADVTEMMPKLGILGTAIGMTYTLYLGHLSGLTLGDESSLEAFWDILFHGAAVSFLTTVVGLIGSIFLSVYTFILKDYTK